MIDHLRCTRLDKDSLNHIQSFRYLAIHKELES